jgi:hypothetical protein
MYRVQGAEDEENENKNLTAEEKKNGQKEE